MKYSFKERTESMKIKKNIVEITGLFWKRTYLFVEYQAPMDMNPYIMNDNEIRYLEYKIIGENVYRAKLNICVTDKREMLAEGVWKLCVDECEIKLSDQVLYDLENVSHVFRYDDDKAYIVTASVSENEAKKMVLSFRTEYMKRNKHPRRRFDSLYLIKKVLNLYYHIVHLFIVKKGKNILFLSENKDEMTGNLKAIHDRIMERGLNSQFRVYYSFSNIIVKKSSIQYWLKLIVMIAKSDYIFVEDYVPVFSFLKLSRDTQLIQTWHAGFGFKSVGYGRFGLSGSPNPYHSCHRSYTYALVGNKYLKEVYTEVFGIPKTALLATGMPRLDNFLDEEKINITKDELNRKYPYLNGKKIILFAPTYRGNNQKEAYYDFEQINQKDLYEYCIETNTVVLFKFHYFVRESFYIREEYSNCLIDMSGLEELNSLFYISDLLVTDYSSCFYDYILLKKPVIFYLYDEAVFSATRGVHRTVHKTVPGKIVRTFDELLSTMKKGDYPLYGYTDIPLYLLDKCKENGSCGASDKVIDYILLGRKVDDV